jgi:peptidyl-prolyl cis-trans isomerase C
LFLKIRKGKMMKKLPKLFNVLTVCAMIALFSSLAFAETAKEHDHEHGHEHGEAKKEAAIKTEDSTEIAVTINGVDVPESELIAAVDEVIKTQMRMQQPLDLAAMENFRKQFRSRVLPGFVVQKLLDEEVKKQKVEVTDEDIDAHLNEMLASQNMTMDSLTLLLQSQGQTIEGVKERIKEQLPYQKLFDAYMEGKVNVTGEDAKKYYDENQERFATPEQVRASHILIKPETATADLTAEQAKEAALKEIKDVQKELADGADFAELATKCSSCPSSARGGDLDFFGRGQMVPEFDKVVFEMENEGDVSDIVETQFGYHILKLTGRKDAETKSFDEVRDELIEGLKGQKEQGLIVEYTENLKAQAKIVYPEGKEPAPMQMPF